MVSLKKLKIQKFRKIAKFKCREICEPQNREINVSQKIYVLHINKVQLFVTEYTGNQSVL